MKETENKIDYSEINWDFIDKMAERMNKNKDKYPKYNFKNMGPEHIPLLEQASVRHLRKMIQPIPNDLETYEDHLYALGCNAMLISYLKNKTVNSDNSSNQLSLDFVN